MGTIYKEFTIPNIIPPDTKVRIWPLIVGGPVMEPEFATVVNCGIYGGTLSLVVRREDGDEIWVNTSQHTVEIAEEAPVMLPN